jgi:glutathione synthase/RimK-type ligase-like ATP-grasp enzyme
MMIALSEASPQLPPSASASDIQCSTEAARLAGWKVYHIPQELPEGVSADDALRHIPPQDRMVDAIWIGYIPLPQHYEDIYAAALTRNIRLINSPEEFRRAEEFDRFYPLLSELTAKSAVAGTVEACEEAASSIGYPVFLKGTIQSLKSKGVDACVARDVSQLREIVGRLMQSHRRTLGKVIVRELVPLRFTRTGPGGFPLGREYRLFVLRGEVVGLGYYWEGEDELASLDEDETRAISSLACEAARRVNVPYLTVDIGQRDNGDWLVIEVGDAQFSGLSQVSIHALWSRLAFSLPSGEALA